MLPGGGKSLVRAVFLAHGRRPAIGPPVVLWEPRVLADALQDARHVFIPSGQGWIVRDAEAQDLSHVDLLLGNANRPGPFRGPADPTWLPR